MRQFIEQRYQQTGSSVKMFIKREYKDSMVMKSWSISSDGPVYSAHVESFRVTQGAHMVVGMRRNDCMRTTQVV